MIKNCVKKLEKSRSAPEQPPKKKLPKQPSKPRTQSSKSRTQSLKPRKKGSGRKPIIDYTKYRDRDLSILSPRQREVLEYKSKFPEMTVKEIASKMGISGGRAGSCLQIAVQKLEGTYDKTRELRRKYYQKNIEKIRESKHNYWIKNKDKIYPKLKELNKKYYLEHREEILEKQRLRRKGENKID